MSKTKRAVEEVFIVTFSDYDEHSNVKAFRSMKSAVRSAKRLNDQRLKMAESLQPRMSSGSYDIETIEVK